MEAIITSKDNSTVKLAAALCARKKDRDETGLFVAEGPRLCLDAAESGVRIRTLLLTEQARARFAQLHPLCGQVQTLLISQPVSDRIADTKTPQGVYAICEKLDNGAGAVTINRYDRYLLLAGVQNPGNLGAMLRTADAMGMHGVVLDAQCADLYAPKTLRGSMGAAFRLPVRACGDLPGEIDRLKAAGMGVWAAALVDGALPLNQVDFSGGGAALIGNEGNGLPRELVGRCTGSVLIPMERGANSLNAAVAAGIVMWEMRRQRADVSSQRG